MKPNKYNLLIALILVTALLFSSAAPVAAQPEQTARVWVTYQDGKGADVLKTLTSRSAKIIYDFPELGAYVVSMPAASLNGVLNNPFVLDVEEDALRYPIQDEAAQVAAAALEVVDPDGDTVPYGIDLVQARDVWDANRDGAVDAGAPTGANRTVCIIDSGYYQDHDDLPAAIGGFSQVDDNWARDGFGHGSHVGGTIAAENNGLGVVGVTPGSVRLFIVKFFADDGNATYASNLVDALSRCQSAGANVVSMSLGGSRSVRAEKTAFQNAYNAGVLSIAAAGNDGTSAFSYPASYDSVVSVAALDANKTVADFSQYNTQVELAAPGVAVLSTVPYLDVSTVTADGLTFSAGHLDFSGRGAVSGALVDGGLCGTTGAWSGKVVLCQRGTYDFYTKVINVQNSGGVAALIYNNVPGGFLGTLGDGNSSAIVGLSLSQEDGSFLVTNKLGKTAQVSSTLTKPASGYEAWDGTSMATPHVSAVAALIWSANPAWTNVQIREALTATAQDLGSAGRDVYYGYGLVQARAALEYLGGGTVPNEPPSLTITSPSNGSTFPLGAAVTFSAVAADQEDGDLGAQIVWALNGSPIGSGATFTTTSLPAGTDSIVATVTDSGGLTASATVSVTITAPVTSQLVVTVGTDKESYTNLQKVSITVTVKDQNGSPVSGASVSASVAGTLGQPTAFSGLTGTSGSVTFSYRISTRKTGTGTYTIQATAAKTGFLSGSAVDTFLVK